MQIERRKHQRYKVKDNAFAIINPEPVRLVPILDVAMEGVGVYVNNEDQWLNKASKLEIMVADCSFYLENLSFESISDFNALPANPSNLFDGRRCSLKFGTLTLSQKSELKYFIRNYAQGGTLWQVMQKFSNVWHPFRAHKHSGPRCNSVVWQNFHRPTV
ncbi:hypothetical protein D1BOALGB6SA_5217 [Olavius sp. associated proteobacterium Delta 1]|nr:hypothetical protein D1BOALGB6SA_5217 [Olavius sp. associated proteobacterium Delta 1]